MLSKEIEKLEILLDRKNEQVIYDERTQHKHMQR